MAGVGLAPHAPSPASLVIIHRHRNSTFSEINLKKVVRVCQESFSTVAKTLGEDIFVAAARKEFEYILT